MVCMVCMACRLTNRSVTKESNDCSLAAIATIQTDSMHLIALRADIDTQTDTDIE